MRYESSPRLMLTLSLIALSLAAPSVAQAYSAQCNQCHRLAGDLREEVIRPFDRTMTIAGAPTLRVDHKNGDVRVRSTGRDELRIQATIRVSSSSRADATRFADRVQINVHRVQGAVTVRTEYPSSDRNDRDLSYSVDYDLLVPDRMVLDVRNSFGDVVAIGRKADGAIVNAHGRVSVSDGSGRYRLENAFGPILLKDVDGPVDVRNRNGAVEVWPVARRGACHDVAVMTSFSPMQVHVPESGYTVAARTTFGTIWADVPITATGAVSGNVISGTIGRGGCMLQLTNTSGNIQILRAPPNRR